MNYSIASASQMLYDYRLWQRAISIILFRYLLLLFCRSCVSIIKKIALLYSPFPPTPNSTNKTKNLINKMNKVAKSANDLVTIGARPFYFYHYLSTSGLNVDHAEQVERGMAIASEQCGCIFPSKQTGIEASSYGEANSLSGTMHGIIKTNSIIDGKNIKYGDIIIGLPSSGLHSNGFTLARSVLERSSYSLNDNIPGTNFTLGESLMAPTVIYATQVLDFIREGGVKSIAHIKGGGLIENISRMLPTGLGAVIFGDSWVVPPIFKWIKEAGRIEEGEMEQTFNMGIGMVLVVSNESALRILGEAPGRNVAYRIGVVVSGDGVGYE